MLPTASKIWLINIFLAAFIIFLGVMSFDVWTQKEESLPEVSAVQDPGALPPAKMIMKRAIFSESAYEIVAEKDLFSPDRSESLIEEPALALPRISEKKIFLYGVANLGGRKQALVSDPESALKAAGGTAKDRWVKVGDAIGNFKVAEIRKDRIILAEGADRYEILLHDENKPAGGRAGEQKSAAPTVVVTGSEPAAAAAATPAPGPAAVKSEPADDEYKTIDTPFGPVKRKVK